ncbi:MAG: tetratricopeptide repeat protein [Akkermansiaceae bacterium]|nr:tetratricopeptide repeat protein [Verrucomicrobiales bacterium]
MVTTKNWALKSSVVLLALAFVMTGCTPKGPRALLDGKKLVEQGRYEEAVEKLRLATSLIGTNAAAWNYLGLAYHHSGQAASAEQAYLKALTLDRNLAEAHYNLGCLRFEEQRFDPARAELIAFTALRGNSIEGWLKLAAAQLKLRDLSGAEKSFNEALRLDRQSAEALNGRGVIQLQRREAREAARSFDDALRSQPGYPPALLNLAIVNHSYLNNRSQALQIYRTYLALSPPPENAEAVKATVQALDQELHPPARLAAVSSTAIASQPQTALVKTQQTSPLIASRSASNLMTRVAPVSKPEATPTNATRPTASNPPSASAEVVKLPPEPMIKPAQDVSAPARPSAGNARVASSSTTKASSTTKTNKPGFLRQLNPLKLFRHDATNSRPASTTPLPNSAERSVTSPERAVGPVAAFPRYKYRHPSKPAAGNASAAEGAFLQASRAQQAGRLAEAIKSYNEAVQLDPAYFEAHYNLGLAATANGNLSQALTAYETALAIRPDSLDARHNFAVALRLGNYISDSVRELENLLAKYPNEARSHVVLGNLYAQQLRQPAKAKEHYVKALELDPRHPQAANIRYWLASH